MRELLGRYCISHWVRWKLDSVTVVSLVYVGILFFKDCPPPQNLGQCHHDWSSQAFFRWNWITLKPEKGI